MAAPPGKSDHGFGKAIDLYPEAAQEWVRAKGRQYGWYWPPETGEPWHFVYVGGGRFEPQKPQIQLPKQQPQIPDAQNYGVKDGEQKRIKYNNEDYVIARDKGKWRVYRANPTTGLLEEVDRTDQRFLKVLEEYRKTQSPVSPIPQKPPGQSPTSADKVTNTINGQISFYGTRKDGFGYEPGKKTTASGAPFNPNGLTAAHKTLPFGTKLRVTNPNSGKTVIVTVTDRGPFVGDRVLDLSYGAAKAIDMTGSGVINGKIEVLGKQGGGYIPKQTPKRDTKKLSSYPSYSAEGGMLIAIQPMIIEKPVPMPTSGNRSTTFLVAGGVNSNNMQSLSRG